MKKEYQQMQQVWNNHWISQNEKTLFARLCKLHRNLFISRFVRHCIEKYFPKQGVFLEAGSGSSESSLRIIKHQRKLIAMDISPVALQRAKAHGHMDEFIEGNLFDMPLPDESMNGIWNLGVMEHFPEEAIIKILNEFYRVMKPNSYAILFWPPTFGSTQIVLSCVENIHNALSKKQLKFFPDEVSVLKGRKHTEQIISKTKFNLVATHFSPRDIFTYYTIVLQK